jgi:hypothetical protein
MFSDIAIFVRGGITTVGICRDKCVAVFFSTGVLRKHYVSFNLWLLIMLIHVIS